MSEYIGFPLYTMMYTGYGGRGEPQAVVVSNTPRGFAEASRDIEASRRDPVLRRLRSRTTPFIYTQATYASEDAGDLWEEQAIHGYRNGIAIALRLGAGRRFALGFDSPDRITSDEPARTALLAQLAAIATVAAEACDRVLSDDVAAALSSVGSSAALSMREAQVLPLLAKGMSSPEIGRTLALSARTVEAHIQGAMAKLGVSRRTAVVAAAMRMDLVDDSLNLQH